MSLWEEKRLDEVVKYVHDKGCDRDMCHPNCPYRKSCQASGHWYPGRDRTTR